MFAGDCVSALVNRIGFWVGRNCGHKIGYWVRSVFSWTIRTLKMLGQRVKVVSTLLVLKKWSQSKLKSQY